jgi:uncharacterized membrane protein YkoI
MRLTLIAAFAACAFAAPAWADHSAGHGHRNHQASAVAVSQERALEIAREQGVANVDEVKLDDGLWEIEGRTEQGRRIEVEINAANGAVVKRELY